MIVKDKLFGVSSYLLHVSVAAFSCRWTLELTPKLTPWAQKLTFTGRSFYTFDVFSGGKISRQKDEWDGLQDNSYFSLEGLSFVLQQLLSGQVGQS